MCKLKECPKEVYPYSQGYCRGHYLKAWKYGRPDVKKTRNGSLRLESDLTYYETHYRLKKIRGLPSEYTCDCGNQACDWAFRWDRANEVRTELIGLWSATYSTCLRDYDPMCRKCHVRFDQSKWD